METSCKKKTKNPIHRKVATRAQRYKNLSLRLIRRGPHCLENKETMSLSTGDLSQLAEKVGPGFAPSEIPKHKKLKSFKT